MTIFDDMRLMHEPFNVNNWSICYEWDDAPDSDVREVWDAYEIMRVFADTSR